MVKTYIYTIHAVEPLAENTSRVILSPPLFFNLSFKAGQYVNILHADGQKSPMTVACAPRADGLIEFHLAHKPDNPLAQDLLYLIKEDKAWKIEEAVGDCSIDRLDVSKPIIFVAQGTGFASVKAILEALAERDTRVPIHFYWVVRNKAMLYMVDVLQQLQERLPSLSITPFFTEEFASIDVAFAQLANTISNEILNLALHQVHVSGTYQFVMQAYDWFIHHGVDRRAFFSDMLSVM